MANKKRIMVVGFSYLVDIYQHKLFSLVQTGKVDIGLLAPVNWLMPEWNKVFKLEQSYPGYSLFPVNVSFLNGVKGGFLYPIFKTYQAIRSYKPDIIHVEQEVFSLSTFQLAVLSALLRKPLTVFCWENMPKSFSIFRRWTRSIVLRKARFIVAGNEDAKNLLRRWGFRGKIFVLPQFGVDTNLFQPFHSPHQHTEFVIGFVGRVIFEKGLHVLIDAVHLLLRQGHKLKLLIYGSGPEEVNLKKHVLSLGIDDYVTWFGRVEYSAVPSALANIDILVLPSQTLPGIWKEQFGHILIEAMAMGIPVVGSTSGAIPEVIGRNDLIFQENKYMELAAIIEKIIIDENYFHEISKYGRDRVSQFYDDRVIAEKLISSWNAID